MEQNKIMRMKELVSILDQAARAYYQGTQEQMSNYEYDKLYDELAVLEKETGTVLTGSPTVQVGYEVLSQLPKEAHAAPMLSLDKTKSPEALQQWLNGQTGLLSWKMDGLTIVLTYENGRLSKAVTRGNGEIGEIITPNARVFRNIPLEIPYKEELILRGEAVITYPDFEKINASLPDSEEKYKNPRNLCSGSVRQLDNRITSERNVRFFAFTLVKAEHVDFQNSRSRQMEWLKDQGFETVYYERVTAETILDSIHSFEGRIQDNPVPSDGLVLTYEDIAYGRSLGRTAKFPRDSIAFKWADELQETNLKEIEWSASRTGLINPVAIFEPVELEGTTVSRASVHNVSIVEDLALGTGDRITVYKANMIIPQIQENLTRSASIKPPAHCPVCGGLTEIKAANGVKSLYCTNPDCPAKQIKSFALFVSRDAINIDGLSEATLEKLVDRGFIRDFADIFYLDRYKEEIVQMEGFGDKSYENLQKSIRKARNTTLARLIYSLGIENIGSGNAKVLARAFHYDLEALRKASAEELTDIEGIGGVIAAGICRYFASEENNKALERLLEVLTIEKPEEDHREKTLAGKVFVITGSLEHFDNREELKEKIEELGGKVTGSVTGKTSYLINNDRLSSSSKNKKAAALGVPILSEEEFMQQYLNEE